jgi:hypothetical protein
MEKGWRFGDNEIYNNGFFWGKKVYDINRVAFGRGFDKGGRKGYFDGIRRMSIN